jgi:hypothetical protein
MKAASSDEHAPPSYFSVAATSRSSPCKNFGSGLGAANVADENAAVNG